eukprot:2297707-Rhodomonas_salina.1
MPGTDSVCGARRPLPGPVHGQSAARARSAVHVPALAQGCDARMRTTSACRGCVLTCGSACLVVPGHVQHQQRRLHWSLSSLARPSHQCGDHPILTPSADLACGASRDHGHGVRAPPVFHLRGAQARTDARPAVTSPGVARSTTAGPSTSTAARYWSSSHRCAGCAGLTGPGAPLQVIPVNAVPVDRCHLFFRPEPESTCRACLSSCPDGSFLSGACTAFEEPTVCAPSLPAPRSSLLAPLFSLLSSRSLLFPGCEHSSRKSGVMYQRVPALCVRCGCEVGSACVRCGGDVGSVCGQCTTCPGGDCTSKSAQLRFAASLPLSFTAFTPNTQTGDARATARRSNETCAETRVHASSHTDVFVFLLTATVPRERGGDRGPAHRGRHDRGHHGPPPLPCPSPAPSPAAWQRS